MSTRPSTTCTTLPPASNRGNAACRSARPITPITDRVLSSPSNTAGRQQDTPMRTTILALVLAAGVLGAATIRPRLVAMATAMAATDTATSRPIAMATSRPTPTSRSASTRRARSMTTTVTPTTSASRFATKVRHRSPLAAVAFPSTITARNTTWLSWTSPCQEMPSRGTFVPEAVNPPRSNCDLARLVFQDFHERGRITPEVPSTGPTSPCCSSWGPLSSAFTRSGRAELRLDIRAHGMSQSAACTRSHASRRTQQREPLGPPYGGTLADLAFRDCNEGPQLVPAGLRGASAQIEKVVLCGRSSRCSRQCRRRRGSG